MVTYAALKSRARCIPVCGSGWGWSWWSGWTGGFGIIKHGSVFVLNFNMDQKILRVQQVQKTRPYNQLKAGKVPWWLSYGSRPAILRAFFSSKPHPYSWNYTHCAQKHGQLLFLQYLWLAGYNVPVINVIFNTCHSCFYYNSITMMRPVSWS